MSRTTKAVLQISFQLFRMLCLPRSHLLIHPMVVSLHLHFTSCSSHTRPSRHYQAEFSWAGEKKLFSSISMNRVRVTFFVKVCSVWLLGSMIDSSTMVATVLSRNCSDMCQENESRRDPNGVWSRMGNWTLNKNEGFDGLNICIR